MQIISPKTILDANLIDTNMTEDDHDEYSALTNYAKGDYCISTVSHVIYRCLTDNGPASALVDPDDEQLALADPLIDDPSPISWQVISATNIWKLFDKKPSVLCTNADSIEVTLVAGSNRPAIGFFNVSASEIEITMTDVTGPTEIYHETIPLIDSTGITDWLEYYTADVDELSESIVVDLPILYASAEIEIIIRRTGVGDVTCGQIVVGDLIDLGMTAIDTTGFRGIDYSYVDNDEYGNLTTYKRAATRLATYDVVVDTTSLLSVDAKMRSFRGGTPAVWIGATDARKAAATYGFYIDYDTVYKSGGRSYLTIEVQGVV